MTDEMFCQQSVCDTLAAVIGSASLMLNVMIP